MNYKIEYSWDKNNSSTLIIVAQCKDYEIVRLCSFILGNQVNENDKISIYLFNSKEAAFQFTYLFDINEKHMSLFQTDCIAHLIDDELTIR